MTDRTDTVEVLIEPADGGTHDTRVFRMRRRDGLPLPPYRPGSHIDVHLPNGLVRQYSLCGADCHAPEYRIAVKRSPVSRGGSAWLHDHACTGTALRIGLPRNAFALSDTAACHLLIAGGIGVTPILSMAHALHAAGRRYRFDYFARRDEDVVFRDEITAAAPLAAHTRLHLGLGPEMARERVVTLLAGAAADTHVYVCGPSAFMQMTVELARAALGDANVHQEAFSAPDLSGTEDREFELRLEGRDGAIAVPPGKSALACLREAGLPVDSSCEVGVCGTCAMRVVAGELLHRDTYLTDDERAAGTVFLPCVSRARSAVLVLAGAAADL